MKLMIFLFLQHQEQQTSSDYLASFNFVIPKSNMTIKHLSDIISLKSKSQMIPNSPSALGFVG